jgi:hypothetical protein
MLLLDLLMVFFETIVGFFASMAASTMIDFFVGLLDCGGGGIM